MNENKPITAKINILNANCIVGCASDGICPSILLKMNGNRNANLILLFLNRKKYNLTIFI